MRVLHQISEQLIWPVAAILFFSTGAALTTLSRQQVIVFVAAGIVVGLLLTLVAVSSLGHETSTNQRRVAIVASWLLLGSVVLGIFFKPVSAFIAGMFLPLAIAIVFHHVQTGSWLKWRDLKQ